MACLLVRYPVDVGRLEIFLKILETRSSSKTAAALGLARTSVSANPRTLENSIGHKLFDRIPRSVKPLPQAFILEPYARRALEEALNETAWALDHQGAARLKL